MIVAAAIAGLRFDQALARLVPGLSRNEARLLIDKRGAKIDGRHERSAATKVSAGQRIDIDLRVLDDRDAAARAQLTARMALARSIEEGPGYRVAYKPSGLPCTPYCFGDALHLGVAVAAECDAPEHGLVHRLDVGTSGLCLFGRDAAAQATLVAERNAGTLQRIYWARVDMPIADHGVISADIAHHPSLGDRMLTLPAHAHRGQPQTATTRWQLLRAEAGVALIEVRIEGGRRHQIRVHLASIGKPVRGDALYGSAHKAPRFALHAHTLHFGDVQGQAHTVSIAPETDFFV